MLVAVLVSKGGAMTTVLQLRGMHACDLVLTRPADAGTPDNIAASSPSLFLQISSMFSMINCTYHQTIWAIIHTVVNLNVILSPCKILQALRLPVNFRPDGYVTYIEILFNEFEWYSPLHMLKN